jgi:hypothetical protein
VWMLFLGSVFLAEPGFPTSRYEQGPRVWLSLKLTTGLADPRGDETGFVLAIHTPPHTDSGRVPPRASVRGLSKTVRSPIKGLSFPLSGNELFFSESRMESINAIGLDRKIGVEKWRDLRFSPGTHTRSLAPVVRRQFEAVHGRFSPP